MGLKTMSKTFGNISGYKNNQINPNLDTASQVRGVHICEFDFSGNN